MRETGDMGEYEGAFRGDGGACEESFGGKGGRWGFEGKCDEKGGYGGV